MTDLTTRLNRLAEAVPDVRPLELKYDEKAELYYLESKSDHSMVWMCEEITHALWGWSILTWLATKALYGHVDIWHEDQTWTIGLLHPNADRKYRSQVPVTTLLEAALSAAEAVAGVQQQEVSDGTEA